MMYICTGRFFSCFREVYGFTVRYTDILTLFNCLFFFNRLGTYFKFLRKEKWMTLHLDYSIFSIILEWTDMSIFD